MKIFQYKQKQGVSIKVPKEHLSLFFIQLSRLKILVNWVEPESIMFGEISPVPYTSGLRELEFTSPENSSKN